MTLPSGVWEFHGHRRFKDRFYPEIILAARLTASRNLVNEAFPGKLSSSERRTITERFLSKVHDIPHWKDKAYAIAPNEVTQSEASFLIERQLAEAELFERAGGSLLVSDDTRVSLQFCGNDHFRWSATGQGVAFRKLWENQINDFNVLDEFEFAFDNQLGFLTADPNEAGGLRLQGILHIPAVFFTDGFEQLTAELASEHIRLISISGAKRPAPGGLVILTHRRSAGLTPEEIVESMEAAALKVARRERASRRAVMAASRPQLEDMIARAFGILKYARHIALDEFIVLHSSLRLGIDFGWIRGITPSALDLLAERVGPAYLEMRTSAVTEEDANFTRAQLVQETLINARLHFDETGDDRSGV